MNGKGQKGTIVHSSIDVLYGLNAR